MNTLITTTSFDYNQGEKIYNEGGNLKMIVDLMENKQFREFYDENFKSLSDVKIVVLFLKMYERLEELNPNLTKYEKISLLSKIINNFETRKYVINELSNWSNEEKLKNLILN